MTESTTRRGMLVSVPAATIGVLASSARAAPGSGRAPAELKIVRRNFKQDGAVGDGAADDGPAIREAIAALGLTGENYWLPKGRYLAAPANGALVHLNAPISLEGDGAALSVLLPAAGESSSDGIRLSPNPHYDHSGLRLSGFAIHDPVNGQRAGRHGIAIDTRSESQNLSNLLIEGLTIGQGSGWAIVHDNDSARNLNGGLWASTIARNQLKGGIRLNGSGDSLRIEDNIISGTNVGIDVALVKGASCMAVERCNITNSGGAIRHRAGHRCTYTGLNIENLAPGARASNDSAVVNIAGEGTPVVGGSFTDSLVSAFRNSDATHLIRLANTRGFTIDRLTLLTGLRRPVVAIEIDASAHDTKVGTLQMQAGGEGGFAMAIVDRGVGTMGVVKTAALEPGWGVGQDSAPLQFLKSFDGIVRLWGAIAGGPAASGSRIATLPPRFRPGETIWVPIVAMVTGRPVSWQAKLAEDGSLVVEHIDGAEQISINASFAAAGLGHSISFE